MGKIDIVTVVQASSKNEKQLWVKVLKQVARAMKKEDLSMGTYVDQREMDV